MTFICESCGELLENEYKYCVKCGVKVEKIRCTICNTIASLSDKYCTYCGKPLVQNNQKKSNDRSKNRIISSAEKKYASTLGINGAITIEEIKKKYKQLIFLYHPDRVSNTGKEIQELAKRKTQEINDAFTFFQNKYKFK